ncbi:MAG: hypothetical protein IT371_23065 [Deltaproteobacteria bacterium]|nr:hypothetical protein [Deltaproteobacteria bacterium]
MWSSRLFVVPFTLFLAVACSGSSSSEDGGVAADQGQAVGDRGAAKEGGATRDRGLTDGRLGDRGNLPPADAGPEACDPYGVRNPGAEALIGPTPLEPRLVTLLGAAKSEILLLLYELSKDNVLDQLEAAKKRGVSVRVLLDPKQDANDTAKKRLTAAGITFKDTPSQFTFSHSKVAIVDGATAIVASANFSYTGLTYQRNYAAFLKDAADVADLKAIFEADWAGTARPDLACTRLLVSPVNARPRLQSFVGSAKTRLDLEVMYFTDKDLLAAVKQRAAAKVPVRVILADPAWQDGNLQTAADLKAAGILVRYLKKPEVHAKLIVVDSVVFVGSQNLSYTAINSNREVGVLLTETAAAAAIRSQFDTDWNASTPF